MDTDREEDAMEDTASLSSSSSEGNYSNWVAPRFLPRPAASAAPGEPVPSTSSGGGSGAPGGAAGEANGMPPNPKSLDISLPRISQRGLHSRNNNYLEEEQRLASFEGFPSGTVDVRQLAAAGFWFTKSEDIVRCAFCNVEVGRWEEGDNPMEEHMKWSKNCTFLKHMDDVGNVPIERSGPLPPLPTLGTTGHDECGIYNITKTENCPIIPSLEKLGIHKRYSPAHPSYATLEARLESFNSWPIALKLRPQELAEAGFFYTGLGDKTICFQCGGGLKDWAETDEPWREHALYFSKCGFVVQSKGREYISEVLGKRPATLTPEEIKALAIPSEFSDILQPNSAVEASAGTSISDVVSSTTSNIPAASSSSKAQEGKVMETNLDQTSLEACTTNAKRLDDARACKICFSEEIGVAFLPCGHLVSCVNCVASLTTCAVCRKPFSATVRVFLS